jgi:protein TonB
VPSAILLRSSYRQRATLGRRASALLLALAATALVILLLIEMGVLPAPIPRDFHPLAAFDVAPVPAPVRSVSRSRRPAGSAPRKATSQPKPQPTPAPSPTPPLPFLQLSSADFAASDIGKMARLPGAAADDGAGSGKDSGTVYGPGEGPGGAPLYNAEWYRKPSHAELATYLPADGPPTGFGLIACRTIAGYHVEDCRVLGETPGSGFGRAIRRAAWQFLVRPPRLGGKPLVGAWVRIRVDFTPQGVE